MKIFIYGIEDKANPSRPFERGFSLIQSNIFKICAFGIAPMILLIMLPEQ